MRCDVKYKLIAMDLDGTLNNDQKVITPKTREALMEAQKRGIRLALASARPSPGLFKERDILQLQNFGGILMSYNGGRITEAATECRSKAPNVFTSSRLFIRSALVHAFVDALYRFKTF